MNVDRSFGDWLRKRRRALDLTQEELARQVGCSAITLRKLEAEARKPSKQIAERLAEILQVPPDDRPAFLRFARGDPFAAPAESQTSDPSEQKHKQRHNLPLQLTSFIGREKEISDVRNLLSTARLVTLTGAGGTGKTRLALEAVGGRLDEFADGVWLVELAPLADPTLVPQTVAAVLGLKEVPGRTVTDTLLDHLRPKQVLLILDNCEHLVQACAELTERLLRACAHLTVLATSREALSILGEITLPVPTLASPDSSDLKSPEALGRYDAVRLFVDRARAAVPGFKLISGNAPAVARVCRQLDGIPLAIELAAARTRMLGVEEIAARLDDRFQLLTSGSRTALPRHQTLRALIDWSYDLLSEPEVTLFRRLAVFAGGWTLDAAEAVCAGEGLESGAVLALLAQLVNKSLVTTDREPRPEVRCWLLETIRHYAGEKLASSHETEAVRRRHANHYLALAQNGAPVADQLAQPEWLARLAPDEDNLRAALMWSLSAVGSAEVALHLASFMYVYGGYRGYWTERHDWVVRALARDEAVNFPAEQAQMLNYAANSLAYAGQYSAAQAHLTQSLSLFQGLGDWRAIAGTLERLGWLAREQGDVANARLRLEESVAICRRIAHQWDLAVALNTLAEVLVMEGDAAGAIRLLEEALALNREAGNLDGVGWSFNHLGHAAQLQGELDRAIHLHEESLRLFHQVDDATGVAWGRQSLGEAELALGNVETATSYLMAALAEADNAGEAFHTWCLAGLAGVAMLDEEPERAARLWGAAEALRISIGARPAPASRATHERLMAAARKQLGEAEFATAWAEGAKLTMEQATELALAAAQETDTD